MGQNGRATDTYHRAGAHRHARRLGEATGRAAWGKGAANPDLPADAGHPDKQPRGVVGSVDAAVDGPNGVVDRRRDSKGIERTGTTYCYLLHAVQLAHRVGS